MNREMDDERTVALYWDFENLHAALAEARSDGAYSKPDTRFKPQEPLVDVRAVVELAASFGPIAINRAYCNWQYFGRYRDSLLQSAIELIQLFPPGGAAKNGADIRLCLDAMEDVARFPHIGTVIVVGGDSDFMPLSVKIKAAGRTLVGVGARQSTNRHWAKSCHEFRYYDSLVEPAAETAPQDTGPDTQPMAPVQAPAEPQPVDAVAELLRKAIVLLAQKQGDVWVRKGAVGQMMKRMDPTFSPLDHSHESYRAMLKAYEHLLEVRDGEHDQMVRLR
ncbi:MAG: NYN domain-containing protein [Burkholderiales bacterium]|jgi:uncharacterized LabA/DUF88 family protein|nr:NYN domain-containing protein [Burkholderiales bacterium]